MAIFGMFKNLLLGQQSNNQSANLKLPPIILKDVNPMDYWEVICEIGEGAFGKIEKVSSLTNSHLIAASKAISLREGENLEDFLVEIEILEFSKEHVNIVGLYACYFYDEKLYMILEYCAGGSINSIMNYLDKPLTESQIAYVTHGVVNALEFLHSKGVIHRDLKSENILLTADGVVKLADFGVSAIMKNNNKRDTYIGTPHWMAPEVIICETFKDQPYDSRSDIWSLGITLIEMAQIDPPNHSMNPMRVAIKIQKSDPPKLAHPERWSLTFSEFLTKCLVKDPNGRWNAQHSTDPRPIVKLLCEKNADVLDEIVQVEADNIEIDSPSGREAIQILDDLCDILDNDGDEDAISRNTLASSSKSALLEDKTISSSQSSVDDRIKLTENIHLSNEQHQPTTIHLSSDDDFPPPEPPIDYDVEDNISRVNTEKDITKVILPEQEQQPPPVHVPMRKSPHRATVTKRTRTYVVDGVEVTSTTMHILGEKQDNELRKKEMRALKRIQREEARQQQELNARADQIREQQERKFAFEIQTIQKSYETEVEAISKAQKKKMEETENQQEEELRNLAKRIRVDQERDLRLFRDRLKQQEKILKQEVGMLPKSQRKPVMKQRQENFEKYQIDKESEFIIQLERNRESFLQKAQDRHRERLCLLERQFLEQKHQLERGLETAKWELEEAQLAEKHALLTQQFRDVFHLQRTHMLARHAKEQEHVRRVNQANEENMLRALTIDRKALPKVLRNESKTRTMMFRKSLEVDLPGESSETWTAKIKAFEEKEKQRIRLKMDEYDLKCKRKLAQLVENNQNNEKRNMLLDNERAKLAEYENQYQQVLSEWRSRLSCRKADLEAKFNEELATQERFYNSESAVNSGVSSSSSSSSCAVPPRASYNVFVQDQHL